MLHVILLVVVVLLDALALPELVHLLLRESFRLLVQEGFPVLVKRTFVDLRVLLVERLEVERREFKAGKVIVIQVVLLQMHVLSPLYALVRISLQQDVELLVSELLVLLLQVLIEKFPGRLFEN